MKDRPYLVRVRRVVEDWAEVKATSPTKAEIKALSLPGVVGVLAGTAMLADKVVAPTQVPQGVEED